MEFITWMFIAGFGFGALIYIASNKQGETTLAEIRQAVSDAITNPPENVKAFQLDLLEKARTISDKTKREAAYVVIAVLEVR